MSGLFTSVTRMSADLFHSSSSVIVFLGPWDMLVLPGGIFFVIASAGFESQNPVWTKLNTRGGSFGFF